MIRRAARMARARQGELLGVHVRPTDGLAGASPELLARAPRSCSPSSAASTTRSRRATSATALVQFARAEHATQLVLGASRQSRLDAAAPRLGDQRGAPRVGTDRRPRHLDRGRPRKRPSSARRRRGRRRRAISPPSPGRRAGSLARRRACRCSRSLLAALRDALSLPSDLLLFLLRRRRRRGARRLRARARRRGRGVPARQLVLHPAAPHVHDRRGREPRRARSCSSSSARSSASWSSRVAPRRAEAARARAEAETLAALGGTLRQRARPAARR